MLFRSASRQGLTGLLASLFCAHLVLTLPVPGRAGEWPQILGPNRDGVAEAEMLAETWPETGPRVVWQRGDLGSGFAGVAVARNHVLLFHRVGGDEVVVSFQANTGQPEWSQGFATAYRPSFTSDDGPRCVPLIDGDHVIVYGAAGGLRCLKLASGEVVWTRETHEDYGAPEGYFGAGSSPIVVDNLVIVNVGGARMGAGVVAFDRTSGKTVWKATEELASYSSPILRTVNGTRHLLMVTRLKALSLDPATGQVRFEMPFGQRGPTVNGANPVVVKDRLFLSASYGVGAVWGHIAAEEFTELWRSDSIMSSQYATCVPVQDKLVGIDGRQDVGAVALKCFDPETRAVAWSMGDLDYGTLLRAGDKLLVLTCGGELILARARTDRYEELARAKVQEPTFRGYRLPALAGGRLYIRDEDTLRCLQVGKQGI